MSGLRESPDVLSPDPPDPWHDPDDAYDDVGAGPDGLWVRTGLLGVLAATLAVSALVAVPTVIGENNRGRSAVTDIDDPTPPEETDRADRSAFDCVDAQGPGALVSPSRELSGGAVLARICAAGAEPWIAPADALTTGLDELVVEINAAGPVPSGTACTAEAGPAFTLTFQYEDRSTVAIRGGLDKCDTMVVGGQPRYGAADLVRLYSDLLAEQRAETDPPAESGMDPGCPAGGVIDESWRTILGGDRRLEMVAAVACGGDADGLWQQPLSPEELALLNDDFALHATRQPPGPCRARGPAVAVRGVDAWGDPLQLVDGCGYFTYERWYWNPSPAVRAALKSVAD